jgi:hypothetical protein
MDMCVLYVWNINKLFVIYLFLILTKRYFYGTYWYDYEYLNNKWKRYYNVFKR